MITFKPKQVTKKLLSVLPERARDVLEKRYGLGQTGETSTLEAIGQTYGITRERVRQIEVRAFEKVQAAVKASSVLAASRAAATVNRPIVVAEVQP